MKDIDKGRVQGAVWMICVHIQQHGYSTYARNMFETLNIPFNQLAKYGVDIADRDVLRPHRKDLMRKSTNH